MHQLLCSNGEEKNYSWMNNQCFDWLVLHYVLLVLKPEKVLHVLLFFLFSFFSIWGLLTKRATGFTDKEPAIILYSQSILKQGCWSETSLPLNTEWWLWCHDLTDDPGSEPLLLSGKRAQHCSFCCLLSRDTLLYLFSVFSEASPWESNHLGISGQNINMQYNLLEYI